METAEIKELTITFHPHILKRVAKRSLSLEKIEETIRNGKIKQEKTKFPKICFTRYYGKENLTYHTIIIKHKNFIEARTAWKKKGR